MNCLTYAMRQWIANGGYLAIRLSRRDDGKLNPWVLHFLWAEKLEGVSHLTTDNQKRHWFKELLCVMTNRHYVEKFEDDNHV
jgi:hypothetical protein